MSIAIENSASFKLPIDIFEFGVSSKTTVQFSLDLQFGYSETHTTSISTSNGATITNDTNMTLRYIWQTRVIMIYYSVQVFELQYQGNDYLYKMRLIENKNEYRRNGEYAIALRPYYYDNYNSVWVIYDNGNINNNEMRYV